MNGRRALEAMLDLPPSIVHAELERIANTPLVHRSEGPRISVRRGNTSELMAWLDGAMEQLERMMISALAAWDETPDEAQGMTLDELLGEIDDVLGD